MQSSLLTDTEYMQAVMRSIPVILTEWTADGIVTRIQGRGLQMINVTSDQVTGCSVFELVQDAPDIQEYIRDALSGEAFRAIVTFRDRIFETYYRSFTQQPCRELQVLSIALDVTERTLLGEHLLKRLVTLSSSDTPVINYEQPMESACAKIETVADTGFEKLSLRQVEILRYASSGMKNAEIAQKLGIKQSTVKWYLE